MKSCMSKLKLKKLKFDDVTKIKFIFVLFVIVATVTFSIPSLARYKNYVNLEAMFSEAETWDGTIATDFNSGSGTEDDPFIISNAAEFAFFAVNADSLGYAGQYFKLSNNIILNNGLFEYDGSNRTYTLNNTLFYLDDENAYDNSEFNGNIISTVNVFSSLENFRGYFDGDYHTIYGLYLTGDTKELSLFKNLSGKVENLYFKNSLVHGGSSTAILANNVSYGEVNNVSIDGIVVGEANDNSNSLIFGLEDLNIVKDVDTYSYSYDLTNVKVYNYQDIILKGTYSSTLDTQILNINGQEVNVGEFEVSLGTSVNEILFSINDNEVSDITITDLVIEGVYSYPIASGFVGYTNDSNFTNVINKAKVYGTNVAGLFGTASNISLNNAYNLGDLTGNKASALIGQVINNNGSVLNKTYNNGTLIGDNTSLIGEVVNSNSLIVSSTFNTNELTNTFNSVSGTVQVTNVYDVNSISVSSGELTGEVNVVIAGNINKELLTNYLGFNEYVDDEYLVEHPDNIWVYEFEEVPVLYVDELNNPVASLNIGVHSWNDIGYKINTLEFIDSKAFNITPLNGFNNFKNVYYYILEGNVPLNRNGIESVTEWIEYEDIVSLDFEGSYIVYVKIVDHEDRNYYINSDVLSFDLNGPDIKLTLGNDVWNSYNASLDSKYINDTVSLNVVVSDKYSEVKESYYYVSSVFVDKEDIEDDNWLLLENDIVLDNKGTNVVYVKSIDEHNHANIINSDYIIYGGYKETLNIGTNSNVLVDSANITDKSSVTYKFTYDENISYTNGYNSNLVLSNKLPIGTIITFIDHKLNNVYSYEVDSEDTIIPLSKFSLVGNKNNVMFDEVAYLVTNKKDVSVIFDFSNATLINSFEFNVILDLRDDLGNVVLSTLKDNVKNTKVYNGLVSDLVITNKSVLYGINYDSNSKNLIEFEYSFNSLVEDNKVINDTKYENMKTGIAIRLVDENGEIIDKKYLKNMEFIVDEVNYTADSDGIVRINLGSNLDKVNNTINVVTYENDLDLKDGNYSLVINPFIASDGKYTNIYSDSNISIPVVSDYQEILDYEFNVKMDDNSKILMKDSKNVVIPFVILSNNEFDDPGVRVSLYKKKDLTAYNQNYDLINLDDYSSNELELASDYSYIVKGNKLELNLDLTNMDKTGYEIRFELFDGDKRIDLIKEKFIVR